MEIRRSFIDVSDYRLCHLGITNIHCVNHPHSHHFVRRWFLGTKETEWTVDLILLFSLHKWLHGKCGKTTTIDVTVEAGFTRRIRILLGHLTRQQSRPRLVPEGTERFVVITEVSGDQYDENYNSRTCRNAHPWNKRFGVKYRKVTFADTWYCATWSKEIVKLRQRTMSWQKILLTTDSFLFPKYLRPINKNRLSISYFMFSSKARCTQFVVNPTNGDQNMPDSREFLSRLFPWNNVTRSILQNEPSARRT